MELLNFLVTTYIVLLIARLFLPMGGEILFNPFLRFIVKLTEPVLQPLRRRIPSTRTGFDLSPLVAAVLFIIIRGFLLGLTQGAGVKGALFGSGSTLMNLLYGTLGILLLGTAFVSLGSAFSYSRFTQIMLALTDPIVHPLRRLTGYRERGFDWAPVLAMGLLIAARTGIVLGIDHITEGLTAAESARSVFGQSTYFLADTLITFLMIVMIARAVVSWVNIDPYNPLVQTIIFYSDPILTPIRRIVPAWSVGLDFSPMFGVILLMVIRVVVHQLKLR